MEVTGKHRSSKIFRFTFKRKYFISILIGLIVICGIVIWKLTFSSKPAIVNPFTENTLSALPFTVYYPTIIPHGYIIEPNSVNIPQSGVVVFDLLGPNGQKVYISQEARPSTFNFGGYYKQFTDLQEKVVTNGTIAAGYINNKQNLVGSLATNPTWVLVNTTANLKPNQFITMLNSLVVSH